MKTKAILCILVLSSLIMILSNCQKTVVTPLTVDANYFDSAFVDTPFYYYKGDSATLRSSYSPRFLTDIRSLPLDTATFRFSTPDNGHLFKYFQVEYNSIAATALTNKGHLPKGGSFPVNSVIIAEFFDSVSIYRTDTTPELLSGYAIIKKAPGDSLATDGWLWGEYENDGGTVVSIKDKGMSKVTSTVLTSSNCVSCHSSASNYDYNWVFTTYP